MKLTDILYLLCGFAIASYLFSTCGHKTNVIHTHTTDTITIVICDTIHDTIPQPIRISVVDTLILAIPDTAHTVSLPITQKHYSKPSLYDVWVSGYQPRLDSVRTYNKVVYSTITNEVTKEVYVNKTSVYPYGGLLFSDGHIGGKIGVMVNTPNKWSIGGEVGYIRKDVLFGINVGYKIY